MRSPTKFLTSRFRGTNMLRAFQFEWAYTNLGPRCMVSQDLLDVHTERESKRALEKIMRSTASALVDRAKLSHVLFSSGVCFEQQTRHPYLHEWKRLPLQGSRRHCTGQCILDRVHYNKANSYVYRNHPLEVVMSISSTTPLLRFCITTGSCRWWK